MAPQAIGCTATSHRGDLARRSRRRLGDLFRKTVSDRSRREEGSSKAAPISWIARQQAMWSRSLEPLRPLDAPRGRPTVWHASWPLSRDLTSVARARRLVIAQLGDWDLEEPADTAELLVSEVVTNALRHTRGPLRLNLQVLGSRLRCEVEDTAAGGPCAASSTLTRRAGAGSNYSICSPRPGAPPIQPPARPYGSSCPQGRRKG